MRNSGENDIDFLWFNRFCVCAEAKGSGELLDLIRALAGRSAACGAACGAGSTGGSAGGSGVCWDAGDGERARDRAVVEGSTGQTLDAYWGWQGELHLIPIRYLEISWYHWFSKCFRSKLQIQISPVMGHGMSWAFRFLLQFFWCVIPLFVEASNSGRTSVSIQGLCGRAQSAQPLGELPMIWCLWKENIYNVE